jgi:hypothetical protein
VFDKKSSPIDLLMSSPSTSKTTPELTITCNSPLPNAPPLPSTSTLIKQNSSNKLKDECQTQLIHELWYHGSISRKDSEVLVSKDGDFLVRESQGSVGQYVLTGMQGGVRKHLLLVDPEGIVRTKDKTFESVSHLINYHRDNGLPIISAESALILRNPVSNLKKK